MAKKKGSGGMKTIIATLALALLAGSASADSVWNYAGNSTSYVDPYTFIPANACGCSLDGSVTLNAANQPVAWSFTAGSYTFTNADSTLALDATPFTNTLFAQWWLEVTAADGSLAFFSQNYDNGTEATDSGVGGLYVQGNHGSWVDPVGTPEPGTLILLIAGLAVILAKKVAA
jgi:hypothetical protein